MAIQSATAKLYQGIRCYVVDKNISAALSASFSLGHTRRDVDGNIVYDVNGVKVIDPNVLVLRIVRTIADLLCPRPRPLLVDERYKTYGGGNLQGVINPAQPWTGRAAVKCDNQVTFFRLDFSTLGIPEGQDCVVMLEEGFVYETKGRKTANGQSNIYPLAIEGAPSARNDFFAAFRTPKTLSFTQTQITASLYNLYGRIRPFAADLTNALGFVVRGAYAPTDRIQMIGTSFFVLPVPVKNAVLLNQLLQVTPTIVTNNRRVRISDAQTLANDANLTFQSNEARYRQGQADAPAAAFMVSTGDRQLGVITAAITSSASVSCDIGKIMGVIETTPVLAGLDVIPTKTTRIQQSLVASSSVSTEGSVPMVLTTITYSANTVRVLPIFYGNVNAQIDWGDGTTETVTQTYGDSVPYTTTTNIFSSTVPSIKHTYVTPGTYKVTISGYVQKYGFKDYANIQALRTPNGGGQYKQAVLNWDIQSFGYIGIESLVGAYWNHMVFYGPRANNNLTIPDRYLVATRPNVPTRLPNTCKDISWMFYQDTSDLGVDINGGNVLWLDNQISQWDTSNVERMEGTFFRCRGGFNTNLGSWNTSKVTTMSSMFYFAGNFRGVGLANWNVSQVTDMSGMFRMSNMKESLPDWDTSKVTNFTSTFAYTSFENVNDTFNGSLTNWNFMSIPSYNVLNEFLWGAGSVIGNELRYRKDVTWWSIPSGLTGSAAIAQFEGYYNNPYYGGLIGPRPKVISIVPDKTEVYEGENVTFTVTFEDKPNLPAAVPELFWRTNFDYPNWFYYDPNGGSADGQDGRPNQQLDVTYGGYITTQISNNVWQFVLPIKSDLPGYEQYWAEGNEYFKIAVWSRVNLFNYFESPNYDFIVGPASPVITIRDGTRPPSP